jgi:hypothetical protein
MTQDQFLIDQITSGDVTLKASELRTLLQNYEKAKASLKAEKEKNAFISMRVERLLGEINSLKLTAPIRVDLRV